MRQITLNIHDSQYNAFMKYVRTLDYVSVEEGHDIPQWQQDEVARRMDMIEKGEMQTRSWDEASEDIFKK